jgi:hypothetical protein
MMTITIDNPQLIHAIQAQAKGLGIPADVLAESALADQLGFPLLAKEVTGSALQPELPIHVEYPAMTAVPRPA